MVSSRYEQNESFFVKMFSNPEMMQQVMDTIGSVFYEQLKKTIRYEDIKSKLSMVAEEAHYGVNE